MVGIGEKIIVVRPFCTRFGLTGYVRMIDDDFIYIDYDQESIKIIKNYFGENGDDILVSFDKLKDYNYICNYENNN